MEFVPILVGLVFAAATFLAGHATGFERDRSFYPVVLIVIALLYVLFGVEDGDRAVVITEAAVALFFSVLAVAAYRLDATPLLAFGFALHGAWDIGHALVPNSDAVPVWWPPFCLGVDLALAAYVLLRWPPRPH